VICNMHELPHGIPLRNLTLCEKFAFSFSFWSHVYRISENQKHTHDWRCYPLLDLLFENYTHNSVYNCSHYQVTHTLYRVSSKCSNVLLLSYTVWWLFDYGTDRNSRGFSKYEAKCSSSSSSNVKVQSGPYGLPKLNPL